MENNNQQWISVKDKLPDNFSSVLVYGRSIRVTSLYQDDIFYPDWETLFHSEITHWMPLPEPPKE